MEVSMVAISLEIVFGFCVHYVIVHKINIHILLSVKMTQMAHSMR